MTKQDFNTLLKKANLTQKEFSVILETSNQTVNNWGNNGREIPYWVNSWLENYIEKQKHQKLTDALKDSGVCGE